MGSDYYETIEDIQHAQEHGVPQLGIGNRCHLQNLIIDKNVRIGNGVRLSPSNKSDLYEDGKLVVREGILCVLNGAIIPDGTTL